MTAVRRLDSMMAATVAAWIAVAAAFVLLWPRGSLFERVVFGAVLGSLVGLWLALTWLKDPARKEAWYRGRAGNVLDAVLLGAWVAAPVISVLALVPGIGGRTNLAAAITLGVWIAVTGLQLYHWRRERRAVAAPGTR